ncbi:MAG: ribonuclease Z [Spirochaetaceae bacterium]|nr:MAG: ribonuclease Z [Spirochaetaceae bacterium]
MNLEAFILGCGGMMPLPNRHLTSMLLRREGDLFLFDCGEGTQVSLRRLNLRWKKISAIFISHTHADHITGLPGMLMLSAQVDRSDPLYIIGPPRVREYVEANRRVLEMYINYEIIVREIENPEIPQTVFEGDGFCIRSFPGRHTRTCVGYSFIEDDRSGVFNPDAATEAGVPRGPLWSVLQKGESVHLDDGRIVPPAAVVGPKRPGRKVTYLTDSTKMDSFTHEVTGSDLLICEGMFDESLRESAVAKKHMTARDAATLAVEAGNIGRMGLIHYSPRYTDRELKILLNEAREVFKESFLTRDRQQLAVEYREPD